MRTAYTRIDGRKKYYQTLSMVIFAVYLLMGDFLVEPKSYHKAKCSFDTPLALFHYFSKSR